MKLLLALTLSLFATGAMACTDFTGTYQDKEGTYSILQHACASVDYAGNDGAETVLTDGKFRIVEDSEQATISNSASFVGNTLTFDARIEYKFEIPSEMEALLPVKILIIYSLDSAGNIIINTVAYNSANEILLNETNTDQKI